MIPQKWSVFQQEDWLTTIFKSFPGNSRPLPKHRGVLRHQSLKEGRHHCPRRGGVPSGREANLRGGQLHAPPFPRQHVRLLPDGLTCLLRDGVRRRRRPHDAHPRGRLLRAEGRLLHGLRCSRAPVFAWQQNYLQVRALIKNKYQLHPENKKKSSVFLEFNHSTRSGLVNSPFFTCSWFVLFEHPDR